MSTPTAQDLADICDRAADVIEHDGHAKGVAFNVDTGGRCLISALSHANRELARERDPFFMDYRAIHSTLAYNRCAALGFGIVWNDAPDTTAFDVIDGLKITAKALRNGELG